MSQLGFIQSDTKVWGIWSSLKHVSEASTKYTIESIIALIWSKFTDIL